MGRHGHFVPICIFVFAFGACAGSMLIEHRVISSDRGTYAEAHHGYLLLENYLIPDIFTFVQQDGAAWCFIARRKTCSMAATT
jgi:hypothetical protein